MDLVIYERLVRSSLEHGVPHEIVAEVFDLPADVTKEIQREVRVAEYGTADQAEYLEHLQWRALKRTGLVIDHGSAADANRVVTSVLGRQISVAGKRTSDSTREAIDELMAHMQGVRESDPVVVPAGRFVVGAGASRDGASDDDED